MSGSFVEVGNRPTLARVPDRAHNVDVNDAAAASVHPLVELATAHLQRGDDGLFLDDAGRGALVSALSDVEGTTALATAVRELVALAYFLETQQSSPLAADSLVDVAEQLAPSLGELGVDFGALLADAEGRAEAFKAFSGERAEARPDVDASPPAGSVKAASLAPRIPLGRGRAHKGGRKPPAAPPPRGPK